MLDHSTAAARPHPMRQALAWLLAILVSANLFAGIAAAEETVDAIYFEGVGSSMSLYVEDEPSQLRLWADLSGGSTDSRDITNEASWSSSNSKIVKVDKGMLTALASGYADITAKYKSASVTVRVTTGYEYDEVVISAVGDSAPAPEEADVYLGEELAYSVSAYKGTASIDVTGDAVWQSSNANVATVDEGVITLLSSGTTTITAKYKGRTDSIKLAVGSPFKSLDLSPNELVQLKVGDDDAELTAIVERKAGGTEEVTEQADWRSANTAIATVKEGTITPVGVGTTTVTASYLGVSKSITVVVRQSHQAMKISADKPLHMLLSDGPKQVTVAVVDDPDETPQDVTSAAEWESSNVFSVTVADGLITPRAPGQAKITATYKGLKKSVQVTVYPGISSIAIEETSIDGFVGGSEELPKVEGTAITDEKVDVSALVEWTSSNTDVVAIEDGKWVGKKTGEATVTATAANRQASITVTVHEKPLALLSDVASISLVHEKEMDLPDLTLLYENGDKDPDIDDKVKWETSSPKLLVKDGKLRGLLPAKVKLTASYLGQTATFNVAIEEEIVKFVVDPVAITLNPGRSKSVKVTGFYKDGKKVSLASKIDWSFSDETVATVNRSAVKAVAEGSGTLSGSYQGQTIEVPVTVKPRLRKLTLSETSLTLKPGDVKTLTVTAEYDNGQRVPVTGAVWTSSRSNIATVTDGKIVAAAKGNTTIRASFEGKSVSTRVSVKLP